MFPPPDHLVIAKLYDFPRKGKTAKVRPKVGVVSIVTSTVTSEPLIRLTVISRSLDCAMKKPAMHQRNASDERQVASFRKTNEV